MEPHDRISALIRRPAACLPSLCTCMHKEEVTGAHREMTALCEPGREPSPGTKSGKTLTLDFPDSRTMRKQISFV